MKANNKGLVYLKGEFGCEFGKDSTDLRFRIDELKLPKFESWFFEYKNRELLPHRELYEELIEEEKVLKSLPDSAMHLEKLVNVEERKVTDKLGDEGSLTQRYFEIWKLEFSDEYQNIVRNNLKKLDTNLLLVTEQEIRNLKSDIGHRIGDNSLTLILNTKNTSYRTINTIFGQVLLYKN